MVPSEATVVGGASISRWKPTTASVVYGVLVGTPSSSRPSPCGLEFSVMRDLRGLMFTDVVVETPSLSVAVKMTSYQVSADASPVVGIVKEPVPPATGPRNGWKWVPWWKRTSVVSALAGRVA